MQPCDVNPQFQQNIKTIIMRTKREKSSKLGLTLSEIIYVQNRTNIVPIYANMTWQIRVNNRDDAKLKGLATDLSLSVVGFESGQL